MNHTGNINFIGTLTDHLDVHVTLGQSAKHAAGHTHHLPHFLANKTQDHHIAQNAHSADVL